MLIIACRLDTYLPCRFALWDAAPTGVAFTHEAAYHGVIPALEQWALEPCPGAEGDLQAIIDTAPLVGATRTALIFREVSGLRNSYLTCPDGCLRKELETLATQQKMKTGAATKK